VSFTLLLAACNPDAPAQTKPAAPETAPAATKAPGSLAQKRLPADDPHATPPPGEDPPAMDTLPSTKGTLDAMIDGKPAHFVRLPPGQNRAVTLPDGGVGRVSIAGSEGEAGLPHLRLIIEGLRPDQAQYPVTIGSTTEKPAKGPRLSMRYEVNEQRVYVTDPAKGAEVQVTLDGWEGTTLRGRFEGKLAPTAAGLGAPIPITGKFTMELGVKDIEPGPAAPAPPAGG
jgi:hypothetical protein